MPKSIIMSAIEKLIEEDMYYYLQRAYITEGKTMREIAKDLYVKTNIQVSPATIYLWIKKYDIPTRQMRFI